MARRKKPARQRWTNVKNSMLYFAWAMDKRPDSSINNLIRFIQRAIDIEKKWIDGDGLREFEERNKLRDAAMVRYRQLFDEKYGATNSARLYFNKTKEEELKEVTNFWMAITC